MRTTLSRLLTAIVAAVAILFVAPGLSSASTASPPPVNSTFHFCNNDGVSNIACFDADLHFVSRTEFQLKNVVLKDTKDDSRGVIADVYDQNGFLQSFVNNGGKGSAKHWKGPISITDRDGVQFVQIALFACNSLTCSSVEWSLRHFNPHW